LLSTSAADGDEGTAPPKYNGLITAASSTGIPVAVKASGAVVFGVVGAAATFLGVDVHPLNANAPARTVEETTDRARNRADIKV
jgi:hypothetical protein